MIWRWLWSSWEKVYSRELDNFHECGDEGEIWFGKQCERRLAEWVTARFDKGTPIVDLGSGNGHFLTLLV